MRTVAVGTEKGAWHLTESPSGWTVSQPKFPGWKVTTFGQAPDGSRLAATASNWFGAAVNVERDGAWHQYEAPPSYPDGGPTLNQIWALTSVADTLYAGVDEAGLFASTDNGQTWTPVPGLNDHVTRDEWGPGFGGLCAHRILGDEDSLWVGISAVGAFHSDDGGETFKPRNMGIPSVNSVEGAAPPEVGYCIHSLAADPTNLSRLWRQDHRGVFRSTDAGLTWHRIENGLPSGFGFPMGRDHSSGRLFVVPLHSDEQRLPVDGLFRVWSSDDDGDSWHVAGSGWSDDPSYGLVLRDAMAVDQNGGVFVGTTSGEVWGSTDNGGSWHLMPGTYPRILSVHVFD